MSFGVQYMPRRAWVYVITVIVGGVLLTGLSLARLSPSSFRSLTFAFLLVAVTVAQLFKVRGPSHEAWHINLLFLFAGVLVLPPGLFAILVIVPHLLEWAKERLAKSRSLRNWYIQPFNIATHIISGLAGYWVISVASGHSAPLAATLSIVVTMAVALTYLLVNHLLVGQVLVLARGMSWRETGVLDPESLVTELGMLLLGYTVALLWGLNPLLSLLELLPLFIVYRSLTIPQLKKEAQTDAKTGLWNSRYLIQLLDTEIERSKRFGRPLAFLMADLDLLREINNRHGHLAGDDVLTAIGRIFKDNIRVYDIAGRFGGDEFGIALPERGLSEARLVAERLRKAVENTGFVAGPGQESIRATMSFGIACYPSDAISAADLMRQADMALYQAKLRGRNQAVSWQDVPQLIRVRGLAAPSIVETAPRTDESAPPATASAAGTASKRPGEGVQATAVGQVAAGPVVRTYPRILSWLLVGGTIAAAATVAVLGLLNEPAPAPAVLAMLSLLAIIAQVPQIKNLSGQSSVSVSVTVNFAAALVAGIPGVVCVSAVISLAHYIQRRPAIYKTFFNWATHVLAGTAPVLVLASLGLSVRSVNMILALVMTGIAAPVYYVIDTGLIASAISLTTGALLLPTWRKQFGWLGLHYLALCIIGLFLSLAYFALGVWGVAVFMLPVLMMAYVQMQYRDRTEAGGKELERMYQELSRANQELSDASQAIRQLNEELFQVSAKIIDARDPFAAGHAAKVAEYAVAVATELSWPSERIDVLRHAAFLHDVGKLGIPEAILTAGGVLDAQQLEIIRRHPVLGAEFLQSSQALRHLAPFVRSHHERWDGGGYPDGLAREMIPPEGRVLAVCDAVEAMASDRPYRPAIPLAEVVSELKRCSGKQFDPTVVEAFLRVLARQGSYLVVNSADEVARRQNGDGKEGNPSPHLPPVRDDEFLPVSGGVGAA
jgi:diguanylate cyclase (GGDEF)-like protein